MFINLDRSKRSRVFTLRGFVYNMDLLVKEFKASYGVVEILYAKFGDSMMANELNSVLEYKNSLKHAQSKIAEHQQALNNAIARKPDDAGEVYLNFKHEADSFENKTFEILKEVDKRISLFERKSVLGSETSGRHSRRCIDTANKSNPK